MNKYEKDNLVSMKNEFLTSTKSVTLTRGQKITAGVAGFIIGGIVLFPIGFLIGPPLFYFLYKYSIQRKRNLKQWSKRNGWSMSDEDQADLILESFKRGLRSSHLWPAFHSYTGSIFHRGDGDARVVLCSIENHSDDAKTGSDYLVAHHPSKCPDITIISARPSSLISKIPWPSNRHKVEFESEEFNKKWTVMSTNPRSAYDYMDQSTIECLIQTDMDCAIEFIDDIVVIRYDDMGFSSTDSLEKSVRWFEGFTKAVPDDLLPAKNLLQKS